MRVRSLYDVFMTLPDPRVAQGKRYNQPGVLALVMLALIAQQNSLNQIATWVAALDPSGGARLGFRFGRMPSYSTIRRVLLGLDVAALRTALAHWAHDLSTALSRPDAPVQPAMRVAIDGKTLRGSGDVAHDLPTVRLLSAFVHDLGATLAQHPIAATTNELGSLPTLLDQLVVDGKLLTLDAHYTTREVITTIRKKGGTCSCA
jgi:hypothetical protein